jgi:hypothetical protein
VRIYVGGGPWVRAIVAAAVIGVAWMAIGIPVELVVALAMLTTVGLWWERRA